MLAYRDLRDRLRGWPKPAGCRYEDRAPLLTAAFPGTFNMSSTEHHWLREHGGYLDWTHDYVFSTVQSCIRVGDVELLRDDAPWHLGVFEMADLAGEVSLHRRPDYADLQGGQIRALVRFLAGLGIGPERVHASYCAGGRVADLTGGAYAFPFEVPPDTLSRDAFAAAGVPAANLLPDRTRTTLLSLHVHRPTPWGYRNEIFVDAGTAAAPVLVDVATAEYLVWRPVFAGAATDRRAIVGLAPLDAGAVGIGVGVERLCAVVNGLARVHDVDHLRPFYAVLGAALGADAGPGLYYAGESLRALHRIYTDLHHHPEARFRPHPAGGRALSTKRRKKAARLKRNVPPRLDGATLERLLDLHACAQPWHAHLADGIAPTVRAIADYRGGSTAPPGRAPRGVSASSGAA